MENLLMQLGDVVLLLFYAAAGRRSTSAARSRSAAVALTHAIAAGAPPLPPPPHGRHRRRPASRVHGTCFTRHAEWALLSPCSVPHTLHQQHQKNPAR